MYITNSTEYNCQIIHQHLPSVIYQQNTHLFDLERTTVHDMFVDFLYSLFHKLFSSELNHPIQTNKQKKKN